MTFTTDIEAFDALSKVKATQADIIAFVRQLSVDVGLPNNAETVLYTGKIGDTEAYKFVNDMPDMVRKLDNRALATRILNSNDFKAKVAQAFGKALTTTAFTRRMIRLTQFDIIKIMRNLRWDCGALPQPEHYHINQTLVWLQ